MFDFEHNALVGLVRKVDGFGENAIEACAFESFEPVQCEVSIFCRGGDVDRRLGGFEQRFQFCAAFVKWQSAEITFALAENIKEYARRGRLLCEQLDARGSRMNAELESVEVQVSVVGDDELTVEYAFIR